ncbi:MAG: alpha/beta hydrolase [Spirochaetales bacterium]|nr:alpha/beta hydrolase [Spirochaetales bacterium]
MVFCIIGIVLIGLIILFLAGPRVKVDTGIRPVDLPEDLDDYLFEKEKNVPGLTPGTEKKIVWAGAPGEKTDSAFLYIHGFSATRQETVPVADRVAAFFNANLYYTRLKGHGRDGDALAEACAGDWISDIWEAWEIGRRIGRKNVIIAVSTGAPLAAWLATKVTGLSALVLISPNFEPADKAARLLLLPWGNLIARLSVGKYYHFEPQNSLHEKYWTSAYRSGALLQMMATCRLGWKADLESISIPILCLYTENDRVISIPKLKHAYERFGSGIKKIINVGKARDHNMTGSIISPETVDDVVDIIEAFLKQGVI